MRSIVSLMPVSTVDSALFGLAKKEKLALPLGMRSDKIVDAQFVGAPLASAVQILIALKAASLYAAYLALPPYGRQQFPRFKWKGER